MGHFFSTISEYLGAITTIIIIIFFIVFKEGLIGYITNKLKGEINKDLEEIKGEINKDLEAVKVENSKDLMFQKEQIDTNLEMVRGKIQKNIDSYVLLEKRIDEVNNRYVSVVTTKRVELLRENENNFSFICSKIILFECIDNLKEFKKTLEDIGYNIGRIKLTLKEKDEELFNLLVKLETNLDIYGVVRFSENEEIIEKYLNVFTLKNLDLDDVMNNYINEIYSDIKKLVKLGRKNLRDKWDEIKEEAEGIKKNK